MIIYFSGTGNTRWCASRLSKMLGDDMLDVFEYIKHNRGGELYSVKPWIFAAPTYAWRLPRVFSDFLRRSSFSGSREAYFVMSCGDDIGSAPQQNAKICSDLGLEYCGTLPVVMPENYIAMFSVPEKEQALETVKSARPALYAAAQRIGKHSPFPSWKPDLRDRMKSGMVNSGFYRLCVKAKPFFASDGCTGCGMCEKLCALGNIHLENGHPVWGERCTHCMACICRCPSAAIEYGKKSAGKPRYVCPEPEE